MHVRVWSCHSTHGFLYATLDRHSTYQDAGSVQVSTSKERSHGFYIEVTLHVHILHTSNKNLPGSSRCEEEEEEEEEEEDDLLFMAYDIGG